MHALRPRTEAVYVDPELWVYTQLAADVGRADHPALSSWLEFRHVPHITTPKDAPNGVLMHVSLCSYRVGSSVHGIFTQQHVHEIVTRRFLVSDPVAQATSMFPFMEPTQWLTLVSRAFERAQDPVHLLPPVYSELTPSDWTVAPLDAEFSAVLGHPCLPRMHKNGSPLRQTVVRALASHPDLPACVPGLVLQATWIPASPKAPSAPQMADYTCFVPRISDQFVRGTWMHTCKWRILARGRADIRTEDPLASLHACIADQFGPGAMRDADGYRALAQIYSTRMQAELQEPEPISVQYDIRQLHTFSAERSGNLPTSIELALSFPDIDHPFLPVVVSRPSVSLALGGDSKDIDAHTRPAPMFLCSLPRETPETSGDTVVSMPYSSSHQKALAEHMVRAQLDACGRSEWLELLTAAMQRAPSV